VTRCCEMLESLDHFLVLNYADPQFLGFFSVLVAGIREIF